MSFAASYAINEEIVSSAAAGPLVYDQKATAPVISTKSPIICCRILPAKYYQHGGGAASGVIQATPSTNCMRSVCFGSQIAPRTQILLFAIRPEVLVNKQLKQAQRLYEKNQQGPRRLYAKYQQHA